MSDRRCAVVQAEALLSLPTGPRAENKRRLLAEFLWNPFLDDDLQGLSLRLGLSRVEVQGLAEELSQEGLLKGAGQRGYLLDLASIDVEPEQLLGERAGLPPEALVVQPGEIAQKMGATIGTPRVKAVTATPPVGLILIGADGQSELVNQQAEEWLGMSAESLNAAAFKAITGIDPTLVLSGAPQISFFLQDPQPLNLTLYACSLADGLGVLIALWEGTAGVELTKIQARIQEELFARLRGEVAAPVLLIQQFLEEPTAEGLGQARVALEQINRFLEDFLLVDKGKKRSTPEG